MRLKKRIASSRAEQGRAASARQKERPAVEIAIAHFEGLRSLALLGVSTTKGLRSNR